LLAMEAEMKKIGSDMITYCDTLDIRQGEKFSFLTSLSLGIVTLLYHDVRNWHGDDLESGHLQNVFNTAKIGSFICFADFQQLCLEFYKKVAAGQDVRRNYFIGKLIVYRITSILGGQ
jgi:hypothetical protein